MRQDLWPIVIGIFILTGVVYGVLSWSGYTIPWWVLGIEALLVGLFLLLFRNGRG